MSDCRHIDDLLPGGRFPRHRQSEGDRVLRLPGDTFSPALPTNAAGRFGVGARWTMALIDQIQSIG
jgi:hypothetical protein